MIEAITIRQLGLLAILTPWLAGNSLFATADAEIPREKPNIIFIFPDDISAKDLKLYNPDSPYAIEMPVMDRLAEEGIYFQTAWANAMCGPSRAVVHTGKYPHKQFHYHNPISPATPFWEDSRHETMGPVMRKAGYTNAWYGKVHFGDVPTSYGFDEYAISRWWDGYDGPYQAPEPVQGDNMYAISWFFHPGIVANGKGIPTGPDDFGPDIEVDHMLDFISRHKEDPFFVYWATHLPHKAHAPDVPWTGGWSFTDVPELDADGRRTGSRIEGSLESNMQYLDHKIGQIISHLESEELLDNTVIFIFGDNGTPGYGKKRYEYDVALRVPFVVWGPGWVKARGSSRVLVDFTDILPTIAELGGTGIPRGASGRSFAPYLLGKAFEPREFIYMEFNNARFLRDERWLLDGYGHFYDCGTGRDETKGYGHLPPEVPLPRAGPKEPGIGYINVSHSTDPEVIEARLRFERILEAHPEVDYEHPETKDAWRRFRINNPPVDVFRPDYLP